MAELPAPGSYVCKCGNTFTVSDSDARAERAEAERDRLLLLAEKVRAWHAQAFGPDRDDFDLTVAVNRALAEAWDTYKAQECTG